MVTRHPGCGAPVTLAGGGVFDVDGREHLCRDYVAWYLPPDRRDPAVLDVLDGWRPVVVLAAAV